MKIFWLLLSCSVYHFFPKQVWFIETVIRKMQLIMIEASESVGLHKMVTVFYWMV